ncbi:MAG: hypothetical protein FWE37_08290 [Spirochaetaceae bacterium]|nr:hypothetical protein [Spirochaetaceae bacterium]
MTQKNQQLELAAKIMDKEEGEITLKFTASNPQDGSVQSYFFDFNRDGDELRFVGHSEEKSGL